MEDDLSHKRYLAAKTCDYEAISPYLVEIYKVEDDQCHNCYLAAKIKHVTMTLDHISRPYLSATDLTVLTEPSQTK